MKELSEGMKEISVNLWRGEGDECEYVNRWRDEGDECCCEIRGKKPPTHRIAFNSLYLFSSKSITYEANGEALYDSRVERLPAAYLSLGSFHSFCLFFPRLHSRKHSGGVASMTRD